MNPTSTNTPTPNPSVQLSPFENHMLISTREDDAAWAQSMPSQVPVTAVQVDVAAKFDSSVDLAFGHNLENYREGDIAHHLSWTNVPLSDDISWTGFQSQIKYQIFDWQNDCFVGQSSDSVPTDREEADGGDVYQDNRADTALEPHTPMTHVEMNDYDTYFDGTQATTFVAQSDVTVPNNIHFSGTGTGDDNAQQSCQWSMQDTAPPYYSTYTNGLYDDRRQDDPSNHSTPWTTFVNDTDSGPVNFVSIPSAQQETSMMDHHSVCNIPVNHQDLLSHDTTSVICVAEKATKEQTRISNQRYGCIDAQGISGSDPWTVDQEQHSDFEQSLEVGRSETPIEDQWTFHTIVPEGGAEMSNSDVRKASSKRRKPQSPAGITKQKTKNTARETTRWYTNREGKVIPISRGYRSDLVLDRGALGPWRRAE